MIAIGKHLSRRTFLRGAGALIGLPLLDAMLPVGRGAALAGRSPLRLAIVYVPNGIVMKDWTPTTVGRDYALPNILKPVEAFRNDFSILSGLMDYNANSLGDGDGDHARAGASFLTGVHPRKTGGTDIWAGISADQIAARAIGRATRFPSLELGLDDNRTVSHCDLDYTCAYTNSISWAGPTTPLPPEVNPRSLFECLFGDIDTSIDAATRVRRQRFQRSILDAALEEARSLSGELGVSDRRKVEEYLASIREIEERIQRAQAQVPQTALAGERPAGIPVNFADHARLMFDLLTLAFQADATRLCTFMMGREASVRTYPEIGIDDPHHPLSHHRNDPRAIAKLAKINTYHVHLFAQLLKRLRSVREGDGTLLDQSMIVYGCGISDSNLHTHTKLPILLAGRGGGSIKMGEHLLYRQDTPVTNLLLGLLDRMGVHPDRIGDSTGKLAIS